MQIDIEFHRTLFSTGPPLNDKDDAKVYTFLLNVTNTFLFRLDLHKRRIQMPLLLRQHLLHTSFLILLVDGLLFFYLAAVLIICTAQSAYADVVVVV